MSSKPVIPRALAERDIEDIVDHYTDQAARDVAFDFIEAFRKASQAISSSSGTGSPRYGDLLKIKGLRSRKVGGFPYLIFYISQPNHIDIWRVLHVRRDIGASITEQ